MGCDIHSYIEYKSQNWQSWSTFAKLSLTRNYKVFAKMAGVRTENVSPVVSPRGFPEDAGRAAQNDYWWHVGTHLTRDRANLFVEYGQSKWSDNSHMFISRPDWHTHSWLTLEEFAASIDNTDASYDYTAAIAAMEVLERVGWKSRIVFWFDN